MRARVRWKGGEELDSFMAKVEDNTATFFPFVGWEMNLVKC